MREPIAIIGLGCRLPGGAHGPEAFWELLEAGRDAVSEVPAARWEDDLYCAEPGVPGTVPTRNGGFLTDWSPEEFDAGFFGIGAAEADSMDPQQRLLLEVAWETLEHAGVPTERIRDKPVGVFVGVTLQEYAQLHYAQLAPEEIDGHALSGILPNFAAGRLAYLLGVQGPAVTLDTACSSSLVAVHLACQSLWTGESQMSLAAGTNLMLTPLTSVTMARWGSLAPDGRCKAFDERADGLGRGEGSAAVLLKPLADARRDGDRVLAVIRGSAVNQDGRSSGITVPNGLAQQALIRRALDSCGLEPADIDCVEAHGTGTALGDPIELDALAAVFGDRAGASRSTPLMVGSVKTNLGHVEAAAGIAGLIKTVLALMHRKIPAHLHLHKLTSGIASSTAAVIEIPITNRPWPVTHRPARAGVSAFGATGTNAHVILEAVDAPVLEAAPAVLSRSPGGDPIGKPPIPGQASHRPRPLVLCLDGACESAVRANAAAVRDWLTGPGRYAAPADVAYTLAQRRSRLANRAVVLAADRTELLAHLDQTASGARRAGIRTGHAATGAGRDAVWVFGGFGSQWPGMAVDLIADEPVFAGVVEELDDAFRSLTGGLSVRAALDHGAASDLRLGPAAIFTVQAGVTCLLRSWHVSPAAVIGHSMGEVCAAVAAGSLTLADAALVVWERTRLLLESDLPPGGMVVVGVDAETARRRLVDFPGLVVAGASSPRTTVVGGGAERVAALTAVLRAEGLSVRPVPGAVVAGHSPDVAPLAGPLRAALVGLRPTEAAVPCYVTSREDPRTQVRFDCDHWVANLCNAVRFADAVTAAVEDGHRLFLEISPRPVVASAIKETLQHNASDSTRVVPTLRHKRSARHSLLEALADLHCHGSCVDWSPHLPEGRLVDLPTYAWQHERHWFHRSDQGRTSGHPLLGARTILPGNPSQEAWQAHVGVESLPWLADHRAGDTTILPGTAFWEMALAAAAAALEAPIARLIASDIRYEEPLALSAGAPVALTTVSVRDGTRSVEVEVSSHAERGRWTRHARALVEVGDAPGNDPPDGLALSLDAKEFALPGSAEELYRSLRDIGQHHGAAFQGVTRVWTSPSRPLEAVGDVVLPTAALMGSRSLALHPALLDACCQVIAAIPSVSKRLASCEPDATMLVPTGLRRLCVLGDPHSGVRSHCRLETSPEEIEPGSRLTASVTLVDGAGTPVVAATHLELAWLATGSRQTDLALHGLVWEPTALVPAPASPERPASWVVIGSDAGRDPLVAKLLKTLPAGRCGQLESSIGLPESEISTGVVWVLPDEGVTDIANPAHDVPDVALARAAGLVDLIRTIDQAAPDAGTRLYVVTRGAAAGVPGRPGIALTQAGLRGVVRTAAFEHPRLAASLIDLPPGQDIGLSASAIAAELAAASNEDEVAYDADTRFVARLSTVQEPLAITRRVTFERSGFQLGRDPAGRLSQVQIEATGRRAPGPGEVELRVLAAGVNFSDILKATAAYPMPAGDAPPLLGGECCGEVVAIGAGVRTVRLGQRVLAVAWGAFGPFVTTNESLVVTVPPTMDTDVAAGIPVAYGTAWYALEEIAQLTPGERVLIHSATGGVGLAALSIAKRAGAEVFATAGSSRRRALLKGLGLQHVMDSRTLDFRAQTLAASGGEGVDVVLNSLPGAALRAGLEVLSPHGHFLELGKRDLHEDARIGLLPFARALRFSAIDFDLLARTRPRVVQHLLQTVVAELTAGRLEPLATTTVPFADAGEAFARMASAQHEGKLVLQMPTTGATRARRPTEGFPTVRTGGSYIITGGLSGIGLAIARWLSERGAGTLVLNARSAPIPGAASAIAAIAEAGTRVEVVLGDIAADGTARRLVSAARAHGRLYGVVHAAALLEDAALANLDPGRMSVPWQPKAAGAWRLHEATVDLDLDWLVLFSSTSGLLGAAGQANYAAANTFLDALAHVRAQAGLAATSVAWGPWARVGSGQGLADDGFRLLEPQDGLAALARVVRDGYITVAVAHFDPSIWFAAFPHVATRPLYSHIADRPAGVPAIEHAVLAAARSATTPARRTAVVARYLAETLRSVLQVGSVPLDTEASLTELGLDSLTALELRNQLESDLRLPLATTLVWTYPTLSTLAEYLAGRLRDESDDVVDGAVAAPGGGDATALIQDAKVLGLIAAATECTITTAAELA
jgi:phthiocerol/phenolphthiocerol synthesis type-I polyketide synthase C